MAFSSAGAVSATAACLRSGDRAKFESLNYESVRCCFVLCVRGCAGLPFAVASRDSAPHCPRARSPAGRDLRVPAVCAVGNVGFVKETRLFKSVFGVFTRPSPVKLKGAVALLRDFQPRSGAAPARGYASSAGVWLRLAVSWPVLISRSRMISSLAGTGQMCYADFKASVCC